MHQRTAGRREVDSTVTADRTYVDTKTWRRTAIGGQQASGNVDSRQATGGVPGASGPDSKWVAGRRRVDMRKTGGRPDSMRHAARRREVDSRQAAYSM